MVATFLKLQIKSPLNGIEIHALLGIFMGLLLSACAPQIPDISGTAYYVDCSQGDDSNEGTSPSQAWESLEHVNRTIFQPGEGIFFKRGTTCDGALTPQGSGEEGEPIIMGAYGRGELPIIEAGGSSSLEPPGITPTTSEPNSSICDKNVSA